MRYKVMREHEGDKPYVEGDVREINEIDAKHLVDMGVLQTIDVVIESQNKPSANKATEPQKVKK